MEHVNVIIVGAGLSGVGAAAHLKKNCPGKTFTLLEGRSAVGGTWIFFDIQAFVQIAICTR